MINIIFKLHCIFNEERLERFYQRNVKLLIQFQEILFCAIFLNHIDFNIQLTVIIMKHNFTLDFSSENVEENMANTKYYSKENPIMIEGVTVILSDSQDDYGQENQISSIKKRLEQFKERKAREIVIEHKRTKESIQQIISKMKSNIQNQALLIIKTNIDFQQKNAKEDISTITSSSNSKSKLKDTDFVALNYEYKQTKTKNYREFTLGQKNRYFSNKNQRQTIQQACQVSQFQCQTEQTNNNAIKLKVERFSDLYKYR